MTTSSGPSVALGVFASGRGSNLDAILAAIDRGDLHARVCVVISNNADAPVLTRARDRGIAAYHISARTDDDPGARMLDRLQAHDAHVVVLAGYMKKLDPRIVQAYAGRSVNIHPAPLPRFGGPGMYGMNVHRAVLASGARSSGPTVHRVTSEYDEGEVLEHRPVDVSPEDTPASLASRVLAAEHDLYWRVIERLFTPSRGS